MQARIIAAGKIAPGLRMYAWSEDQMPLEAAMAAPHMQYSDWIYVDEPSAIELCGWAPSPSAQVIKIWRSEPQENRMKEPVMRYLTDILPGIVAFTDNQPDKPDQSVQNEIIRGQAGPPARKMSVGRDSEIASADINFTTRDIHVEPSQPGRLIYVRNTSANPISIHPEPGALINGSSSPWELKAWTTIRMVREHAGWTGF